MGRLRRFSRWGTVSYTHLSENSISGYLDGELLGSDNISNITVSDFGEDVYKRQIEKMAEDGTFDVLPKKEVIQLKKEWEKLEKNLGGIKNMTRIPDAIFVVDPKKERICVQEAHILGITLIGIGDTNCDPEELDFIIPGNDDAIRAVKLITSKMADAVIEANQGEAVYDEAALATEATDIEEVAVEAETAAE